MTEKLRGKKAKVDQQKFQIVELLGINFKITMFNMFQI